MSERLKEQLFLSFRCFEIEGSNLVTLTCVYSNLKMLLVTAVYLTLANNFLVFFERFHHVFFILLKQVQLFQNKLVIRGDTCLWDQATIIENSVSNNVLHECKEFLAKKLYRHRYNQLTVYLQLHPNQLYSQQSMNTINQAHR